MIWKREHSLDSEALYVLKNPKNNGGKKYAR
jgi:hypothetical protein